ncbi:DsrE family protein [Congregibacter sp.]|uniref:DsrE family protein n=1 Tax=Congregibacter sp. TaxID=2744308 RepID=UPI003F6C7650
MRSFLRNAVVLPALAVAAMTVSTVWAAEPTLGPVVPSFGPVMAPPPGSYNLDPDVHYKVSMDMYTTPDFPEDQNRHLISAARFLNMHARNGIPAESIEFALIVHGKAAKDLLTDEAYEERYNEPNPNTALLKELNAAKVPIYLCSQTAAFRGMAPEEFSPAVTMSLSAMTAHVRLQQEGYTLVPF